MLLTSGPLVFYSARTGLPQCSSNPTVLTQVLRDLVTVQTLVQGALSGVIPLAKQQGTRMTRGSMPCWTSICTFQVQHFTSVYLSPKSPVGYYCLALVLHPIRVCLNFTSVRTLYSLSFCWLSSTSHRGCQFCPCLHPHTAPAIFGCFGETMNLLGKKRWRL